MDFKAQVAEEKKRLTQERKDAEKRVGALESELSALRAEMTNIDGELAAIEAYEAKAAPPPPKRRQARKPAAAAPAKRTRRRRRRGSRRAEIMSAIAAFGAAGAGRAEIIGALDVKGDKSAEQSVSNALAALKKSGAVAHEDGKYIAQAEESAPAPEAREGAAEALQEEATAEASAPAAPRRRRRRRSSRREAILSIIAAAGADGVGRGDIIGQLNVKGDKSAEQSVSNALAAMKKAGEVAHGDGKYHAG